MTALILEDELPAANRLTKLLKAQDPDLQVLGPIESLAMARAWVRENPPPDIVFCDIHLADGTALELLRETDFRAPVVFTTAYDAYALQAFKTAGVDYLLKPVKPAELAQALRKVAALKAVLGPPAGNPAGAVKTPEYRTRFAVRLGDRLLTIQVDELAYCFTENRTTFARTRDGRTYPLDVNLDVVESTLDPKQFFRLNRQYVVHIRAILDMRTYSKGRVTVTLCPAAKETPVVSSERAAAFKTWLADG